MTLSHSKVLTPSHWGSPLSLRAPGAVIAVGTTSAVWTLLAIAILATSVATSVHHAEAIAAKVGPSLGAVVLALAVTVIEVG